MPMKIDTDFNRFKEIVKGKVKSNMTKFVSSSHMTGSVGGKLVKIPLNDIDLPRFTFGNQNGGTGMGDGDEGDPMPGQGKGKGKGKGEAGEDEGDHPSIEFTPAELAAIMSEYLELPELLPKGKGETMAEGSKYTGIAPVGVIKHHKKTYLQSLKRQISTGDYNPSKPSVIPIKRDVRYKISDPTVKPDINAVIYFLLDCSGSMDEQKKQLAKNTMWWVDLLLRNAYKKIDTVYILHDTRAWETTREEYFSVSTGGGTQISSAYKLVWDLMQRKYPHTDYNSYILHGSDSENSSSDNPACAKLLEENILPNCNVFSYASIKGGLSEEFYKFLERNVSKKVKLATIEDEEGILSAIKGFFGQGL